MRAGGILSIFAVVAASGLSSMAGVGCAEERLEPAPFGGVGGGSSTASTSSAGGSAPVRRTVTTRNPLGNVAVSDNLLWDGDFEWLSSFADQYPWLYGKSFQFIGYDLPKQVLGAACKSGVKCIELPKGGIAIGSAVASRKSALEASVHVATESDCSEITVALLGFDTDDPDVALEPKGRFEGWCYYQAVVSERESATWLYIENGSSSAVRVDDAVVRRASQLAFSGGPAEPLARDFRGLKRELRRRAKPHPRVRDGAEASFVRELERRRTQ